MELVTSSLEASPSERISFEQDSLGVQEVSRAVPNPDPIEVVESESEVGSEVPQLPEWNGSSIASP